MKNNIIKYLKISRYRFWFYTAGPFLLGIILGIDSIEEILNPQMFFLLFYFLIPFNFFIYAINDYFDQDTDIFNPKKTNQETAYKKEFLPIFKFGLTTFVLFSIVAVLLLNPLNRHLLIFLILISFFYSAPPLRFKSKPFIDSLSNVLYAIPGFIGFLYISNTSTLPFEAIYIGIAYTGAMHLFSAVPDIESDKKAKLKTTAVFFGEKISLYLCLFLWFSISILLLNINKFLFIVSLIYPFTVLYVIFNKNVSRVYWWFPYINTIVGFLSFWILVFSKFGL